MSFWLNMTHERGNIVFNCMTGIVGNKWSCSDFSAMDAIPAAVREIMGTDSLKSHITEKGDISIFRAC